MRLGVLRVCVSSMLCNVNGVLVVFFFQAEDGIRDLVRSRGLGDVYKRQADVSVVAGDARISLEQELIAGQNQNFDVLVLDTFSSDSIPVHLVTKEAFALYLEHLAPKGVIAAHISNRHLDLQPVFWQLAEEFGLAIIQVEEPAGENDGSFLSEWVLLTHNPALFEIPAIKSRSISFDAYNSQIRLWTDDYSNLFQILK